MTVARLGLCALLLAASGCTSAVVSDTVLSSGRELRAEDLGVHTGASKVDVLAELGPPVQILAPATGDVFVYRLAEVDQFLVQINSSLFGGPGVPLWAHYDGLSEDAALYVFFDPSGTVSQLARRGALAQEVP